MRILIVLVITLFCAPFVDAATYYVSKSGSDANSCASSLSTTQTNQKLTIGDMLADNCLSVGDRLEIHTGTYAENLAFNASLARLSGSSWGTASTIAAYSGETVTIDAIGGCASSGTTSRYIIIERLNLIGGVGISACGGSGVIDHIRFDGGDWTTGSAYTCVQAGGDDGNTGHYNEYLNLTVHGCGIDDQDHGFYIQANNVLIQDTTIYDTSGYCIHNADSVNLPSNNTYNRLRIYQCTLATEPDLTMAVVLVHGSGNILSNSLIYHSKNGVQATSGSGNFIYNNTIYNNGNSSPSIPCGDDCYPAIESTAAGNVVRNNIVYGNNQNSITNSGAGAVTSNNLTTDPSFVNAATLDFHLQTGSAAKDAGTTIGAVTTDFDAVARPQGAAYDIGAYEFVESAPTIAPASGIPLRRIFGR